MIPKQTLPIFPITVPSSGKKLNFRQFTVREEKMMAQAKESGDAETIVTAVKEVIKACIQGIDLSTLALFDVEYIITKIRAKSVGEKIDLNMLCSKDENHPATQVRINLDEAEVVKDPEHKKVIELYDGTGVTMRYPTLDDLAELEFADDETIILVCLESIYTPDEVYKAADHTREEMEDYINSLTEQQMDLIKDKFLFKMPAFTYTINYKCGECGTEHTKTIKGLTSFFG